MLILITYDVNVSESGGGTRLRKVAKTCENYGIRVQNSVFECNVDASQSELLKASLLEIIDEKKDSLRLYYLGNNYKKRIEHYGTKEKIDMKDTIII
ncbi:CRISPR-associated protein, Cas2 family [[Clostridium] aminophilum]|uniref:CRISPR-associated endoribonuclease Cas2 n=1 Tax=[Clostridium] aminophilum TaxID=1526 RepID=A0A1I0A068_9FIRM|nr:CRISPR-associated endonuclease Cas2 [[Clostridium] aminophilum]SES87439.1 CRISPR-associated protein, Cas2 family [[Clostridium] aminophilum]